MTTLIMMLLVIGTLMALWMIVETHRLSYSLRIIEQSFTVEHLYHQIISPNKIRPIVDEEGFIVYE